MRVMHMMAGARHGGAELFFERFCEELARHTDTQQAALIRPQPERIARLQRARVQVRTTAYSPLFALWTRMRARHVATSFRPDLILAWMSRAAAPMPAGPWIPLARLGGFYHMKYFRHCRHLIVNTNRLRDYVLSHGWPGDRVHFLANFVRVDDDGPPEPLPVRQGRILLALGRLHSDKAFDILIRAMAELPQTVQLWLAGTGPLHGTLQRLAGQMGVTDRVQFLGWRSDRRHLIEACDVVVLPSRVEPFGNVIAEGWCLGKPVVAAARTGPAEFITDGENGRLVPLEDPTELARAIQETLDHPDHAARMAACGQQRWTAHYAPEQVIARYQDLFAGILARESRSADPGR